MTTGVRDGLGRMHAALSGGTSPAFAPYVWELAAERAGVTVEEMTSSASRLVSTLVDAARLLDTHAICVLLTGAETGVPLEAVARLAAMNLPYDVVAVLPGPAVTAAQADDAEGALEAIEDLARDALDAGASVLVLDDPAAPDDVLTTYRTIVRQSNYHGAHILVVTQPEQANAYLAAGVSGVDVGPAGPYPAGVAVAPAAAGRVPEAAVVTSGMRPRPTAGDAEWLMAAARAVRARPEVLR